MQIEPRSKICISRIVNPQLHAHRTILCMKTKLNPTSTHNDSFIDLLLEDSLLAQTRIEMRAKLHPLHLLFTFDKTIKYYTHLWVYDRHLRPLSLLKKQVNKRHCQKNSEHIASTNKLTSSRRPDACTATCLLVDARCSVLKWKTYESVNEVSFVNNRVLSWANFELGSLL